MRVESFTFACRKWHYCLPEVPLSSWKSVALLCLSRCFALDRVLNDDFKQIIFGETEKSCIFAFRKPIKH